MKSSDERLIDWVFDSPAPHAVEISKWKYEGSTTFSLLIEGARGLKKVENEIRRSRPLNQQTDKWTTKPNNQTNISTARTFLKRFKEIHITEHQIEHLISNILIQQVPNIEQKLENESEQERTNNEHF